MTPFPYFVETDDDIAKVRRLIDEHRIHHIPVQQEGRVIGVVVTERTLDQLIDRVLPNAD